MIGPSNPWTLPMTPWGGDPKGSPSNPFASTAERDARAGSYTGEEVWMSNPLAPRGRSAFYWSGTRWTLSPNQTLACWDNDDGSLLLDLTATLLTVGATQEIWASPALPLWMFGEGGMSQQLTALCELGQSDSLSTASASIFFSIRTSAYISNDAYGQIFGYAAAVTTPPRGFSVGPAQVTALPAGTIVGREGIATGVGGEVEKTIGDWGGSTTKARISWRPGASTNRLRVRRISLSSGAC